MCHLTCFLSLFNSVLFVNFMSYFCELFVHLMTGIKKVKSMIQTKFFINNMPRRQIFWITHTKKNWCETDKCNFLIKNKISQGVYIGQINHMFCFNKLFGLYISLYSDFFAYVSFCAIFFYGLFGLFRGEESTCSNFKF